MKILKFILFSLLFSPFLLQSNTTSAASNEWGEIFECNDWIPDQPSIWREIDTITKKWMCKKAISPAAKEASARAFDERIKNPQLDVVSENEEISRYTSKVDTHVSNIYKHHVTAQSEVGTSAGALLYHKQMKEAAFESIEFLNYEISKHRSNTNFGLVEMLNNKKKQSETNLFNHNRKITELIKDREDAQAIEDASPAIIDAITKFGTVLANNSRPTNAHSIQRPDPRGCVKVTAIEHNKFCGRNNDINFKYYNSCNFDINYYFCIQKLDGKWLCDVSNDGLLKPNRKNELSSCDVSEHYAAGSCKRTNGYACNLCGTPELHESYRERCGVDNLKSPEQPGL